MLISLTFMKLLRNLYAESAHMYGQHSVCNRRIGEVGLSNPWQKTKCPVFDFATVSLIISDH